MNKLLIYILFAISLTSCIPDENPVKAFDRGDVTSGTVTLGANYTDQIFYSFDNNEWVKSNGIYIWDLGFTCKDSSNEVILNYSKFMKVADLGYKLFDSVNLSDLNALTEESWKFDNPNGHPDSTGIGRWWDYQNGAIVTLGKVYIIDRGTNEIGKKLGNVKFQILDYDYKTFKIIYANLKDNVPHEFTVTKDASFNYVYLSFEKVGNLLQIEPPKETWDVVFSKYTELLYTNTGEAMWYSVVGGYMNVNGGEAAMVRNTDFTTIDKRILDTLSLSKSRNAFGHDWKYFDLNTNAYVVNQKVVYILKSVSGFYYKLHFMDFYDDSGNKGTPKFEFQKL